MYTKFDFEKFKRSRIIVSKTLGALDALGEQVVDFAKYHNRLNYSEKNLFTDIFC